MFEENPADNWPLEREKLLQRELHELGLKLEGTRLEKLVARLHEELEQAGIRFKPKVYLSDEWGCPDGVPIIGIPFYLADAKLSRIEDEIMEGIEAETDEEILSYLRHEAGHAFNYAYKLYETDEWRRIFGPFSRPYRDRYRPNPFSLNFVRHIPGWYAQKHPDEDFAETFAVWLTPDSNWRETYREWGCYRKLLYVDRIVAQHGQADPLVEAHDYDPSLDLRGSVLEHYDRFRPAPSDVPAYFDGDLKDIFARKMPAAVENEPTTAQQLLTRHRRRIIRTIHYWTGLDDSAVRSLVSHLIERCKTLGLYVHPDRAEETLLEVAVYATALCMNKLYKRDFILK